MNRKEKIELLKQYREALLLYSKKEEIQKEKEEPQKVLVLRKKFNGKDLYVA